MIRVVARPRFLGLCTAWAAFPALFVAAGFAVLLRALGSFAVLVGILAGLAAVFGLGEQLPAFSDTQLLHTRFFPGAALGSEPALAASEMGSNNRCTNKPTTTDHKRGRTKSFRGFRELLFRELLPAFTPNLPAGGRHKPLPLLGYSRPLCAGSCAAYGLKLHDFRQPAVAAVSFPNLLDGWGAARKFDAVVLHESTLLWIIN